MAILLRGHVRTAFDDECLRNLIEQLHSKFGMDVYVHTWNKKQSSISWRIIEEDNTPITEDTVRTYFNNASYVKSIVIEDDTECILHGRVTGFIGGCPILGWKRMHAGIKSGLDSIPVDKTHILNMRLDVLSVGKYNGDTCIRWTEESIIEFVNQYKGEDIKFMVDHEYIGIDNCYMGNNFMRILCDNLHIRLDDFAWLLYGNPNQERLVFRLAHLLLASKNEISNEGAHIKSTFA